VEADAAPAPELLGQARVTWASVSLADKLDTLVGLFKAGETPTGSRDPFGLRRQAHGVLRLLLDVEALTGVRARPTLATLVKAAAKGYGDADASVWPELVPFLYERLQYVLETRGFDRRNVRAVLAQFKLGQGQAVVDTAENLKALPEFSASEQFRQLATAFKRVRNIARELGDGPQAELGPPLAQALKEPAEVALLEDVTARAGVINAAVAEGRGYREAYAAAAAFEPAIARFFKEVFVMTDDATLRQARLRLMKRLEHVILQLGDISEIVGTES
jgi:glycyl-tRNA synthetase beta chain